jgi:hypothetical protein
MKPITPTQVSKLKVNNIPDVVIEAVNNLLAAKCDESITYATLLQKDILKEIRRLDPKMTSSIIFENHWLDFEPIFRKSGWKVVYDKPAYCESYEPSFEFTAKRGTK